MILKNIGRLIVVSSLLILAQCGDTEDADTKAVSFTHIAAEPIVIEADFTYVIPAVGDAEPTAVTVTGPWFQSKVQFTNGSGQPLTVQTVKYTIESVGNDGNIITQEHFLDPGDLPANKNESVLDDQRYVAFVESGETSDGDIIWYIGGLADRKKMAHLKYRVKAEAIGWFGFPTEPVRAFKKTINFNTNDDIF